jgi:hypothetical protein
MKRSVILSTVCFALSFAGCQSPQASTEGKNSPYTHGNVQLALKQGTTTQAEVLEKFGAPNITAIDSSGQEVWTYEKHATVSAGSESGSYASIIALGASRASSRAQQSSRTMTLIIKFGADKKVSDFKSLITSF